MGRKPSKSKAGKDAKKKPQQTSVRLNKEFARRLSILARHKGTSMPELIELWTSDKVAEEYQNFLDEMGKMFGKK